VQITSRNFGSSSLDDWQLAFYDLYGDIDRDLPLYDIMLQIVADSTRIAEAMRRGWEPDVSNSMLLPTKSPLASMRNV
jgi:hypothetical protein